MGLDMRKDMVDLRKDASASLRKHNVSGKGVKVYLALDYSGSMAHWYANGGVQYLTEQVLALSAELDDDGDVEVWFFDTKVDKPQTVSLSDYQGWVENHKPRRRMGLTNYADTIKDIARYHRKHGGGLPGLVVFQSDGSPYTGGGDARGAAVKALRSVSGDDLFFAFVGFGTRETVDFLFQLDTIDGRVRDNASAYVAANYAQVSESELYDGVLGEFVGQWLPDVLG